MKNIHLPSALPATMPYRDFKTPSCIEKALRASTAGPFRSKLFVKKSIFASRLPTSLQATSNQPDALKKSLATYVTKSRKNAWKSDKKSNEKSIQSHPEFDPKWRKSEPQSTPKRRQMVVFNSAPFLSDFGGKWLPRWRPKSRKNR